MKRTSKAYGRQIAAARKASRWPTQAALGAKFGVTGKTVSDWELANTNPGILNQGKIAKWLGVER